MVRVSYEVRESKADKVSAFLTGLFARMDVSAQPHITEQADGSIDVELTGESIGAIIGRRGEMLDAIQHLTNYAVNHGETGHVRVTIDAENYRAKRVEALERLAQKVAAKAVKYRRNVMLEPMNAYERHIILSLIHISYMLPELILSLVIMILLVQVPQIRKILGIQK